MKITVKGTLKKQVVLVSLLAFAFAAGPPLSAHGGEEHKKKTQTESIEKTASPEAKTAQSELSLEQFPSLHPMVVHFPIVFLLVAPALWLLAMFTKERNIYRIAFVSGLFGLMGALVAGTLVHPHTSELLPEAQAILEKHDFWAEITIQSALAAIFFMGGALWNTRFVKYFQALALVSALLAATSVSLTGHYGAILTHVHGVGPQGKYLELDGGHVH